MATLFQAKMTEPSARLFAEFAHHSQTEEQALEAFAEMLREQGFKAAVCKERPLFGKDFPYLSIKRPEDLLWGSLELCFKHGSLEIKSANAKGRALLDELSATFSPGATNLRR